MATGRLASEKLSPTPIHLAYHLAKWRQAHLDCVPTVVLTSGGYDPPHSGHLACIQAAARLGELLIVVVNGDEFLVRKKGYAFMPVQERMLLLAGIEGVDHVVPWQSECQTVAGALRILRPDIFAKGGDRRSAGDMAEAELQACAEIGCVIRYGVGGVEKVQSSSHLVERAIHHVRGGTTVFRE